MCGVDRRASWTESSKVHNSSGLVAFCAISKRVQIRSIFQKIYSKRKHIILLGGLLCPNTKVHLRLHNIFPVGDDAVVGKPIPYGHIFQSDVGEGFMPSRPQCTHFGCGMA